MKLRFADMMIEGHRETWPIRSSRFRMWLRRKYYEATGKAPSAGEVSSALNLLEARGSSMGPRERSTSGSPSVKAVSTSTLRMSIGARSRSTLTGGGSSPVRRSDFGGRRGFDHGVAQRRTTDHGTKGQIPIGKVAVIGTEKQHATGAEQ